MDKLILSLCLCTSVLTLQACGSESSDKSSADKINSVVCSQPEGFGSTVTNYTMYDRGEGSVTFSHNAASDANSIRYMLAQNYRSLMNSKLDIIDLEKVLPTYTSEFPATPLDGSVVTLVFKNEGKSVKTLIDANDSSYLPEGIGYVFEFCGKSSFKDQGVLQ